MHKTFLLISFLVISIISVSADNIWKSIPDSIVNTTNAQVIKETDSFIHKRISSSLEVQAKLLATNNDTIICLVKTLSAPEKESKIVFYNAQWNKLNEQTFSLEDIIGKENSEKFKSYFNPLLISAQLMEDSNNISISVSDYMISEDDKKELKDLPLQKSLQWNGNLFK